LETFFLDDEAGADESAGNNGQDEPNQIAGGVHLMMILHLMKKNLILDWNPRI